MFLHQLTSDTKVYCVRVEMALSNDCDRFLCKCFSSRFDPWPGSPYFGWNWSCVRLQSRLKIFDGTDMRLEYSYTRRRLRFVIFNTYYTFSKDLFAGIFNILYFIPCIPNSSRRGTTFFPPARFIPRLQIRPDSEFT